MQRTLELGYHMSFFSQGFFHDLGFIFLLLQIDQNQTLLRFQGIIRLNSLKIVV